MGKRNVGRGVAVATAVLAGTFATIGTSPTTSTTSGSSSANSTTTVVAGPSAKPGAGKTEPIAVGTQIKVSSGWEFKVNSAALNANAAILKANEFNEPDDGKQFVMVNVSMINRSGQPDAPLANFQVSMLPPSGVSIDESFAPRLPNPCDLTTQLQPGAEYTCNTVFQVKSDEVDGSLLLVEPVFTSDRRAAQRFFALK